jgi:hypothetical protein
MIITVEVNFDTQKQYWYIVNGGLTYSAALAEELAPKLVEVIRDKLTDELSRAKGALTMLGGT